MGRSTCCNILYLGFAVVIAACLVDYWHHKTKPETRRSPAPRHNWDTLISFRNHSGVRTPSNVEEVRQIVLEALETGDRVKAVGGGHSWSNIAQPEGAVFVSLDRMSSLIDVDANCLVTVEAGMRLHELYEAILARGCAMPNIGTVDEQSIAGAAATSTHGSSIFHGSVATAVKEAQFVAPLAGAPVLTASALTGENEHLLQALRVHLGALGIVTRLKVQAEPAYRLRGLEVPVPLDELLDMGEDAEADVAVAVAAGMPSGRHLRNLVTMYEYSKFWVIPYVNKVNIYTLERVPGHAGVGGVPNEARDNAACTSAACESQRQTLKWLVSHADSHHPDPLSLAAPLPANRQAVKRAVDEVLRGRKPVGAAWGTERYARAPTFVDEAGAYVMELLYRIAQLVPSAVPALNQVVQGVGFSEVHAEAGHSHSIQLIPFRVPVHTETEYIVPARNASQFISALEAESNGQGGLSRFTFIYELRFVKGDDLAWMSGSPGAGEPWLHVTVGVSHADEHRLEASREGEKIALRFGGHCHWGKRWFMGADTIDAVYGERVAKFRGAVRALDPCQVFRNSYLEKVGLYDEDRPVIPLELPAGVQAGCPRTRQGTVVQTEPEPQAEQPGAAGSSSQQGEL